MKIIQDGRQTMINELHIPGNQSTEGHSGTEKWEISCHIYLSLSSIREAQPYEQRCFSRSFLVAAFAADAANKLAASATHIAALLRVHS